MTNEKMLEKMYEIYNMMEEGEYIRESEIKPIIEALKEDIRHDCQKKKGNVKRDTLLKKLIKKANTDARPITQYYQPVGENQYGFLDGYKAYVLNDSYGYESAADHKECGEPIDLKRLKPKNSTMKVSVDLDDLKAFIKEKKAEMKANRRRGERILYILHGENDYKIGANAEWLLEFCQMFDTDYVMCNPKRNVDPMLYESESGEWGILLPIRLVEGQNC